MEHKFAIPVGDWSDDGHGKCDVYHFVCNYPVEDCRRAYIESCKKTGVQFHHGAHTFPYDRTNALNGITICTEYEDYRISQNVLDILSAHGLDVIGFINRIDTFYVEEDEDGIVAPGSDIFACLIMEFIGLSLNGLRYELQKRPTVLNGFWNEELNVQFGYGLYD